MGNFTCLLAQSSILISGENMSWFKRVPELFIINSRRAKLYGASGLVLGSAYKGISHSAASKVGITSEADLVPFESAHGEIIEEIFGNAAGVTAQHSLARCRIPNGKKALVHYHPMVEESYYILSGTGTMNYCPVIAEHDDKEEILKHWKENKRTAIVHKGDSIGIPQNNWHQMLNNEQEDLVFIVACAPSWTPDCSVYLDSL